MLRSRGPDPAPVRRPDPAGSLTVGLLTLIGVGLLIAAILAVYSWTTPGLELPLVIALSLAFGAVLLVNLLRLAVGRRRG